MKRQHDILLVDPGKRNEGLDRLDAFLLEQILIGSVPVDDNRLRKQYRKLLTALAVALDNFDIDSHADKLIRQIVSSFSTADNHGISDLLGIKANRL